MYQKSWVKGGAGGEPPSSEGGSPPAKTSRTSRNPRILVIGAGAAGMMAAGRAAELGAEVTIVEHMDRTGLKLGITGKGRCNLTNNCPDDEFMRNVPRNPKFLYSALSAFSTADTMKFFEDHGLPLKTERGKRVFPVSDRALDVVAVMRKYSSPARLVRGEAKELVTTEGRCAGIRLGSGEEILSDAVIVCTGGLSYPQTGSTGTGYSLAGQAGLKVTERSGSLVPLTVSEGWCAECMGLSLKNVGLKITDAGKSKPVYSDFGEMMFAHFGLTGPMILSASAYLDFGGKHDYTAVIDLKPALDEKTLDARVLRDWGEEPNREFQNSLGKLLPSGLIPVIVRYSGIPAETRINSVTREQRADLVRLLKALPLHITGRRPVAEAVVTRGGVDVKELDPRTMEAKKLPGLYFAGEVIDVDAYTGGFNLQIAWMTARLAAESACGGE